MNSKDNTEASTKSDSASLSYLDFPTYLFKDRSLSVLEIMVEFLVDHKKMSYHNIAALLNRDDRTIWTVYSRVKKKRKK